jgi:Family of unknown function (DUF6510)
MDARYDGNTLAGPLTEVFTADVTTGVARCRSCGRSSLVAELAVYGPGPGLVARCRGCDEVMLRVTRTSNSTWLDLSGMSVLQLPAASE